jgi:hypothetical protein
MGRGNGGIIGPTNDPKFCGSATFTFNAPGTFKAAPSTSAVNALLVAGGGGGGEGGGGAGGFLPVNPSPVTGGNSYPVTVGAGGAGAACTPDGLGSDGANSTFNGNTATGGGGGASFYTGPASVKNGRPGGSGGGGSTSGTPNNYSSNGGSGTPQGNNGSGGWSNRTGGGGGGKGGAGGTANNPQGALAGPGSPWPGDCVTYAGGGRGGNPAGSLPACCRPPGGGGGNAPGIRSGVDGLGGGGCGNSGDGGDGIVKIIDPNGNFSFSGIVSLKDQFAYIKAGNWR